MVNSSKHRGVMTSEVIELLQPKSGGVYLDGTFGGGGHSQAILEASSPGGKVIALDRDPSVAKFAGELVKKYSKRFEFHVQSYDDLDPDWHFDGAVMDLGLSTDQLETEGRGFSFSQEQMLDMRFDQLGGQTAEQWLAHASNEQLVRTFSEYGQDRYSKRLARKVIEQRRNRPIKTTSDFVEVVGTSQPSVLAPLFQALRIVVNDELVHLKRGLEAIYQQLNPGGRLVVISFHSLEDRIVKNFFREVTTEILTKKPLQPSIEELAKNNRARSAKLRAGQKEKKSKK